MQPSEIRIGGQLPEIPCNNGHERQHPTLLAAKKEALRLGFTNFASDLINAGNEARGVINLACIITVGIF
jgi:hypothetical protein